MPHPGQQISAELLRHGQHATVRNNHLIKMTHVIKSKKENLILWK